MSRDQLRDLSNIGGIGFSMVSAVLIFTGIGYGADRLLGTAPWLMVAGVFVGAGVGFAYMIRAITRTTDTSDRPKKTGRSEGDGSERPDENSPRGGG